MQTIEGLREEIEAQAQQFRRKRVRVIVLDTSAKASKRRDWNAFFAELLSRPAKTEQYDFEALRREHLYEEMG